MNAEQLIAAAQKLESRPTEKWNVDLTDGTLSQGGFWRYCEDTDQWWPVREKVEVSIARAVVEVMKSRGAKSACPMPDGSVDFRTHSPLMSDDVAVDESVEMVAESLRRGHTYD